MRISSSLVSFALCLGFAAAAVVPNAGDISTRDNAVSEGRLSRRLPEDTGKSLAGVVENIKRGEDDGGLAATLEQLLDNLGEAIEQLLDGNHK